jgi:hypothetical protein
MLENQSVASAAPEIDGRSGAGTRWSQERRLEFIEFRLLWEGKINRGELVNFFGTSIQQASLDISRYSKLAPGNLEYDKSDKVYRVSAGFTPVITQADSREFLDQLCGSSSSAGGSPLSFVGWRPSFAIVQYPTRTIRPDILMRVIWAIRDREAIELTYQSMRRPVESRRWISPHAIAFDGTRWHVRAWCHENSYFKDFVFARILRIFATRPSDIDATKDHRWHSHATVVLRARHDLTPGQQKAVETEYGMQDGRLKIRMREALVFYFARQLRMDSDAGHPKCNKMIEWVNSEELSPLLIEAESK